MVKILGIKSNNLRSSGLMFHLILKIYNTLPLKLKKSIKKSVFFSFFREFFLKGIGNESKVKTEAFKIRAFFKLIRPIQSQFPLIRIGGRNDGGYLIPDDLAGVEYSFSPGVGNQISFDLDLAQRGIQSFLADGSIDQPPANHHLISFDKVYIGIKNTGKIKTLDNWIKDKIPNKKDFILQMDIEGAEYEIIRNLRIANLTKFRIMVIEFHGLDRLISKRGFNFINPIFKKILKYFDVVHIHPNNFVPLVEVNGIKIPPVTEFTFLRKDRVRNRQFAKKFPHPLDQKNDPERRNILLPELFYK